MMNQGWSSTCTRFGCWSFWVATLDKSYTFDVFNCLSMGLMLGGGVSGEESRYRRCVTNIHSVVFANFIF
jgi:hypothetical protein